MRITFWTPVLVLAGVLLLAGCADSAEDSSAPLHIGMLDNSFSRAVTRVPVGRTIEFSNLGRNPHNAKALDGSWQTLDAEGELVVKPGGTARVKVDEPGVYRFICTFHAPEDGASGMVATLVVGDVDFDPTAQGGEAPPVVEEPTGVTRAVPAQYPTIQAAVDAATPGDLVLVGPGVYREEVKVATPSITIRGTDRNAVIVDAEFVRPNGISVTADGVAVENLTTRNGLLNGVFWTGVEGYRASYVTAYNNADYGIYAFDSVDGVFEHSYGSGSPDAGVYIGQCQPCKAVVADGVYEHNGLGYSGTNAGGELYLIRNRFQHNIGGVAPNTLDSELLPPVRDATVVGNVVRDNGNLAAPVKPLQWPTKGFGIVVAGGIGNHVERNLVVDNPVYGIIVTPNLDQKFWPSQTNVVRDNVVMGSGRADLAMGGPLSVGNCFSGNTYTREWPVGLEALHGCGRTHLPFGIDLVPTMLTIGEIAQRPASFTIEQVASMPVPPPQPQLPGGPGAPVVPAVHPFEDYDLDIDQVPLPEEAATAAATRSQEAVVFGIPLFAAGPFNLLFGLYGALLPFVLYAAWVALALWDLARRDTLGKGAALGWIAVILLVPFLGAIAYHVVGRSQIPAWLRGAVVGGGLLAYLVILGIGAVAGGIV